MSILCVLFDHRLLVSQPVEQDIYRDDERWWFRQPCLRCDQLLEVPLAPRGDTKVEDFGHLFYGLVALRDDYEGHRVAYRISTSIFDKDTMKKFSCNPIELTEKIRSEIALLTQLRDKWR